MPAAKPNFLAGLLLSEREQEVLDLAGMLHRRTPQEWDDINLVSLVVDVTGRAYCGESFISLQ